MDSPRDGSVVLLLLPIIASTQRATAWPTTQRSDFVSATGRGIASAPKKVPGLGVQERHCSTAGIVGTGVSIHVRSKGAVATSRHATSPGDPATLACDDAGRPRDMLVRDRPGKNTMVPPRSSD